MKFVSCEECGRILTFFVPENQNNKYVHSCRYCDTVNELAITEVSLDGRPVYKVVGIHSETASSSQNVGVE